jgi:serine protease AprX
VNGWALPYDDQGHGTHCASIAAGAVNAQGVGGAAPGAALIGLKVLSAEGRGSDRNIIAAVEWCIANRERYGIDVISMSLGGDDSSDGQDPLSLAVNRAVDAGMVVLVAAGNSGPGAYTISSPAAAEKAITVGNMVDMGKGGFALWFSSSHGPTADGRVKPDLCAPGYQILAAKANSDGYTRMTGTSMATPFAAGVAGLMRQANPQLGPAQVKALLKQTAVHFGRSGENNEYGAGRLDGYAAVAKAAGKTGAPPAMPSHLFALGRIEPASGVQAWSLPVDDTRFPVGITVIAADGNADFDVEVYDPSGALVLNNRNKGRQELAAFRPQQTGVYTVVVRSYAGFGDYTLDVSSDTRVE